MSYSHEHPDDSRLSFYRFCGHSETMDATYNFSDKVNPFKTPTDSYRYIQTDLNLITDVITLIVCSFAIVADIVLIVSVVSLKKLQCRTNYYIMHFAIFNCLYFVVTPPIFILFQQTAFSSYYSSKFLCALLQTERTCLTLGFFFAFGLSFQWFVSSLNSELGNKFTKFLKYLPYALYTLGLINYLVALGLCFIEYSEISVKIHDSIYLIIFCFCLLMNIIDYKFGLQSEEYLSKVQSNTIIFCWLPFYIHKYLYKLSVKLPDNNFIKWVLESEKFLFEWPAYGSAIVVFFVFYIEMSLSQKIFQLCICQTEKTYDITYQLEDDEQDNKNEEAVGDSDFGNNTKRMNRNVSIDVYL